MRRILLLLRRYALAKKNLLANDPLGDTADLMDGILERNRERSGRAKPEIATAVPEVIDSAPIEPPQLGQQDSSTALYTTTQPDNPTTGQPRMRGSVEIDNASEPVKQQPEAKSSGNNEVTTEDNQRTQAITVRERAVELAQSVRIPPATLSTRIPEAIGDRLDELALRFKKLGVSKQSLAIALLERGLAELEQEEGWRSRS